MIPFIAAWTKGSEDSFEEAVPLKLLGERNKKLGFDSEVHVVFLEGYSNLGGNYIGDLEELGFVLHDAQKIYLEISEKFKILDRFGDYEKKCFLRWLTADKIFNRSPLVHLDGDVILNLSVPELIEKSKNLNFVLQGCPALTVISDVDWMQIYISELEALTTDIEGYSKAAWEMRSGWRTSMEERWTGSRSREIVTSDQDLISHLLHIRRLPQNTPAEISKAFDGYMLFEQPLAADVYYKSEVPFTYSRKDGIDYFNRNKIALWHFQSDFCHYLARNLARKTFHLPQAIMRQSKYASSFERAVLALVKRATNRNKFSRRGLCQHFLNDSDFSSVFDPRVWWHPDVFRAL